MALGIFTNGNPLANRPRPATHTKGTMIMGLNNLIKKEESQTDLLIIYNNKKKTKAVAFNAALNIDHELRIKRESKSTLTNDICVPCQISPRLTKPKEDIDERRNN